MAASGRRDHEMRGSLCGYHDIASKDFDLAGGDERSELQADPHLDPEVAALTISAIEFLRLQLARSDREESSPGVFSGSAFALATRDVYRYLKNAAIRHLIDNGVAQALSAGGEAVGVAHSLGTVVAYNVLALQGSDWAAGCPCS